MTSEFVGRLAVAVWIGKLTEDAAREVLRAYSAACRQLEQPAEPGVHEAILAEYRRRREGQDLCS